ncbi:MAG: KamA family radical SAM protein [Verrucomicrobia bacterium]|nr:KamA family radical SAM protein [Verrucomicrobiota bacterium]
MSSWRAIQKENFTDHQKLAQFLQIDPKLIWKDRKFPLNLPKRLAEKIEKGSLEDPILRQFLPKIEETHEEPGFSLDAVGDVPSQRTERLLHKYQGRALILSTSACVMHCRFCFRKNFPYAKEKTDFSEELDVIANDSSIEEVLLSGGDPLSLGNQALEGLFQKLNAIPHVKRIRFHTRFPIGIPERIDSELLRIFALSRAQIYFIVHCNHPRELDEQIFKYLSAVQRLGIPVLTSTVLLRGVNDNVGVLKELFTVFIDHGILPYCISQLDRVMGISHFEVPMEEGKRLMAELAKQMPGYSLPRYVQEVAGAPSKIAITYVEES